MRLESLRLLAAEFGRQFAVPEERSRTLADKSVRFEAGHDVRGLRWRNVGLRGRTDASAHSKSKSKFKAI